MGTPRLAWRANRAKRGWEGWPGGEGDGAPWQHTGMGCWAEGKSRAVGRWKEGGLLCLHPELLPDFGEEALNNPPAHKVSTACTESQAEKCNLSAYS